MKKAKFIGFDEFYSMVKAFRILWLKGRFGGGKTALAVMLGARLFADRVVNGVVSNLDLTFGESPIILPMKNRCIILDESWIYITTSKSVIEYAAFVRKLDHYLLLPSVYPPHSRLTMLTVERIFNGYALGIPAWVYRWVLNVRGMDEKGYFIVVYPSAVFGAYDSSCIPATDGGLSNAIKVTLATEGYKTPENEQKGMIDDMESTIDEQVQSLDDKIIQFKEIVAKSNFRRRR